MSHTEKLGQVALQIARLYYEKVAHINRRAALLEKKSCAHLMPCKKIP